MPAVPLSTERLSVAFRAPRRAPVRLLNLSLSLSLSIAAGLVARFGAPWTRTAAALLLLGAVAQIFLRRARDRRDFGDVQRTIRRVLVPVDRAVGERALRAAALAEQAAREGLAPIPMPWLDSVRVTVQPPAYLHLADRAIFPGLGSAEASGSAVTVHGVPLADGRHLVLTDGTREVPFVADGSGGVVARYVLNENAELRVAARFGKVLIREADGVALEAVPDALPAVELEGAPERIELRNFDRRELRYEARDDHGLRQVDLVLRAGGREDRRPLTRLDGETKLIRGAYAIESSDPFLRRTFLPVEVRIEARDDDVTAGVKWGKSEAFTLIPTPMGESEAARYAALRAVRDHLTDLLASELSPDSTQSDAERRKADRARADAVAAELRAVLDRRFAGVTLPQAQRAFLGGQARVLSRALPTPASAMRRTEDVLLAVDAALRGLGNRDAVSLAKRLGDVAEEVAEGAKQALDSERRQVGLNRLQQALFVLGPGARNLVTTELAARHLAARLRRPSPSFSTAGGGGVESGAGAQSSDDSHASDADKKFDELVGELERLADEHQRELDRVERNLADAEKAVD